MNILFALVYTACAVVQFVFAHHRGGWGTELGALHYYFGIYIAFDAAFCLHKAFSK